MFIALLRASARTFDPAAFLDAHALDTDNVWRAGELGPGGRVRPESGFILTIVEAPSPRELMPELRAWLESELDTLNALADAGVRPVIELRMAADIDPTMIATVTLDPAELSLLAALGVSLRVSVSAAERA
jgi:hypothetical protein